MAVQDFEDILPYVGSFGAYQKRILVMSLPINYFLAVVFLAQVFQTLVPDHFCSVPELLHLPRQLRRNLSVPFDPQSATFSKCRVYDVNFTQLLDEYGDELEVNSSWPMKSCAHGWDYDFSGGMYPTIVTELNWVCDDDWRPNFAQSMFFGGAIVGSLVFGLLSDAYGRRPVLVLTNLLACAAGIATAFAHGFVSFVTCRFVVGLSYDLHYMMMYIILMEYVGPEKRTLVGNVPLAVSLTIGLVSLPWIAYGLADWRLFSIVTSAPLAVTLVALWIVPESARWMVLKGKIDQTIETLKQCAAVNGQTVPQDIYDEFQVATQKTYEEERLRNNSWLDLFHTPGMRKRMILMILAWMMITLVYDGHLRSLFILPYSAFVTNCVAGSLELPADLVPLVTLDTIGRRWTCFMALATSGLSGILVAFVDQDFPVVVAILAMIGRFCITIAMNAGIQYTVELIPTQLRGQGVSLVHIAGHIATFFAPFVLYLSTVDNTLPYIVLGVLSVTGGVLCLLLPETAMEHLPESVQDAELFGQNQSFCDAPCLRMRRNENESRVPAAGSDNPTFDQPTMTPL